MKVLFLFVCVSTLIYQGFSQVEGRIAINGGATITNNNLITILIKSRNADQMLISNRSSFEGVHWGGIVNIKKNWNLTKGDGLKTVYAKFRDARGNISEEVSATIELDRIPPPIPDFIVNRGLPYFRSKDRYILIEISGEEIFRMHISTRKDFLNSRWKKYISEIKNFPIPLSEGKKTIYAQFADLAGNKTKIISSSFTIDTKPPSNIKIIINKGERYTNSQVVHIDIFADGASQMIIRKPGSEWEPFLKTLEYKLPKGDGEKKVIIKFKDKAGNVSSAAGSIIILDTKPPTGGKIELNNGVPYTKKFDGINIKLFADGASGMIISKTPNFEDEKWLPYRVLVSNFALPDIEKKHIVYVKFKDKASNISQVYQNDIILDKRAPEKISIHILAPNAVYDENRKETIINDHRQIVDLELSAEESKYMIISNIKSFYGASWIPYNENYKGWKLKKEEEEERDIYAKFRDEAGNISEIVYDKIIVDVNPPVDVKIIIDRNKEFSTNKEGKVQLQLFARGASHMMISNDPSFKNGEWEIYHVNKVWRLNSQEDNIRSVFVKYKDVANNESKVVEDNIILDRIPPTNCSILINKGENLTNNIDKLVLLKLVAKEARLMQISNIPDFRSSHWEGYSPKNKNWNLSGLDGEKIVYVRFKDGAGNISPIYQDNILLDRSPPKKADIIIDHGKEITNNVNKLVTLLLYGEEAHEMKISNRYDFQDAKWKPYINKKEWILAGHDGFKIVYAKFRDKINNESEIVYDKIGVDTKAPTQGRIEINGNAKYVSNINKYVSLRIYVREAEKMMISNEPKFRKAKWIKYKIFYQNWILEGDDGKKTVYVQFKDKAHNATKPVSDKIILDRQEPFNEKILINNDAKFINSKYAKSTVDLQIKAEGEAYQMMLSNNKNFREVTARWMPYTTSIQWKLPLVPEGLKSVYVKFRDMAGNESIPAYDNILVDTHAPRYILFRVIGNKTDTEDTNIIFQIQAKDAEYMMLSNNSNFSSSQWEIYSETKNWTLIPGIGPKKIYIKFKDKYENVSTPFSTQITLFEAQK